ncbi:MAG: Zn-dependent hydrolase [Actinomycetota bacterium]
MEINADRLWDLLAEVNRFGALESGGVERLAWTEPEVAARGWLADRCEAEGFEVDYDEAGNVWAFAGSRPAVMLGSHLDTVPNGGRFDGALGIVSALEALLSARATGVPGWERLGLLCFTDEEGVRFGLGMTGSRALSGDLEAHELRAAVTADGTGLAEVLERAGFDGDRIGAAAARRSDVNAYLEVHVEQGRRLERAGRPVGIVTGIVGLSHWRVEVMGEANHAGTTLPDDRGDAFIPIAGAALEAQRVMQEIDGVVATVGEAEVIDGATNIVPGHTRATLDVRSLDEQLIDQANERIIAAARGEAERNRCELTVRETKRLHPAPMAAEVLAAMRVAAGDLTTDVPEMPSMAGHDAMTLTKAGLSCGMVFVRSEGGISHSPRESSSRKDCVLGARLLAGAALQLATRA